MEGHVRKRGNKWYYSFESGMIDGKRKRIERVGGMMLMIGYYTGCRIGEVSALTWEDVDLKNGIIHITKISIKKKSLGILELPRQNLQTELCSSVKL